MKKIKPYIHAIRLRTLPLALSSVILGSFLAVVDHHFSWQVIVFAILTTVFLQILSNLANDYGDYTKGTDKKDRIGPTRMVTSGAISPKNMVNMIVIVVLLALISGLFLIYYGIRGHNIKTTILFFIIGIVAIISAIKYTVGKNPYGYIGLGDLFVFIFFGLVGVIGTFYLHTGTFRISLLLPAISIGLLCAGVLNVNNMRDFQSDKQAGKRTLVVLLGNKKAKVYHFLLISGAFISTFIYSLLYFRSIYQFLFMLSMPLFIQDVKTVLSNTQPIELNPELKKLALSTLLFSICFGVGLIIGI
jgi:1,4-dihydroxy-2-naphthoate octaprenyltransferase